MRAFGPVLAWQKRKSELSGGPDARLGMTHRAADLRAQLAMMEEHFVWMVASSFCVFESPRSIVSVSSIFAVSLATDGGSPC
jgi:hypothetical protein